METEPLVSVVMPAYNSAAYIKDSVESILAQTYLRFELIVVDDGSTDRTADIVAAYQKGDPRIKIFTRPHGGITASRNFGLQQAQGTYLAWLDSDDLAHPQRLALQVAALRSNPKLVVIGSAYQIIDAQGSPGPVQRMPEKDTVIRWHSLFHCPFAQSSVICCIEVLRSNALEYDATMPPVEDYELWSRLLQYGRGYNLPEPLVHYRLHPDQASQRGKPALWELAGQVAQKNLAAIGATLPLDQVQRLREWYYTFPQRFSPDDLLLAEALVNILNRFSLQPGLDRAEVQHLRGRWLGRLLRAGLRSGYPGWFLWMLRQLSFADWRSLATYIRQCNASRLEAKFSSAVRDP